MGQGVGRGSRTHVRSPTWRRSFVLSVRPGGRGVRVWIMSLSHGIHCIS